MKPGRLLPLLALLLTGCGLFNSRAERALKASPDYKAGYNDGCGSAGTQGANRREDSLNRDPEAFASNKAYHAGWNTGFNACRLYQPQSDQPGLPSRGGIGDLNGLPR